MKIIIPVKQVPETSNVRIDPEKGTMKREGVESIINPLDLYAIETGLQIREKTGGEIIVMSMGPHKAEEALREAVAMGCDRGILISDKSFAGADTWSTSYTLSQTIKKLGKYDLVLCGERATDGDTGQVGPAISAWLDIPIGSYVSEIIKVRERAMVVKRLVEEGYETIEIEIPCLLTMVKEAAFPRLPTLRGKQRAKGMEIPVWGPEDIDADYNALGLKGSLTRVVKIASPKIVRDGDIRIPKNAMEMEKDVEGIISYLKKIDLL